MRCDVCRVYDVIYRMIYHMYIVIYHMQIMLYIIYLVYCDIPLERCPHDITLFVTALIVIRRFGTEILVWYGDMAGNGNVEYVWGLAWSSGYPFFVLVWGRSVPASSGLQRAQ